MKNKKISSSVVRIKKNNSSRFQNYLNHQNPDGSIGGKISPRAKIGYNVWIDKNVSIFGNILIQSQTQIGAYTLLESHTSGDKYWLIKNEKIKRSIQRFFPKKC